MPDLTTRAKTALGPLFSGALSAYRYGKWKDSLNRGIAAELARTALGEIFWLQSLGRPNTANLSDGFSLEIFHIHIVDDWDKRIEQKLPRPYPWELKDGRNDGKYWRVTYVASYLETGARIAIVPKFVPGIRWKVPAARLNAGAYGRRFEPGVADFVKGNGAVHRSFEIVPR